MCLMYFVHVHILLQQPFSLQMLMRKEEGAATQGAGTYHIIAAARARLRRFFPNCMTPTALGPSAALFPREDEDKLLK